MLHEQQAEDHKRKGAAIVQPRFAGQTEAQRVVVLGIVDLNQTRQHRIGRRQDRAHQQRHPPRQIKQVMQQQPGAEDGQQHDRAGQAEGDAPGAMLERQAQFKAADKQRKQHCHFGQVLHPARRPLDVQVQQVHTEGADGDAEQQAHRRSGDRHPAQVGGREG